MRYLLQIALVAAIFSCLAGCFPMLGTFYAPTASEGRVGGNGREPSSIHLTRGDKIYIQIFTASDDADPDGRVVVDISVPQSESLRFTPGDVQVIASDGTVLTALTVIHAWTPMPNPASNRRLDRLDLATSELPGDRFPGASETMYALFYRFKSPRPDVFHVRLPAMQAGGKDYPTVDILFTKTRGWWIQPVM